MPTQTYTPIARQVLASAQSTITFSSIPSTYTDLVLVAQSNTSALLDAWLRFNNDTATNYSDTRLYGTGSAAASDRRDTQTRIIIGDNTTNGETVTVLNIMNYSNTTTFKTVLVRTGYASSILFANVGLWRKTPEAINRIDLLPSSGTYSTGSTFTLYGIKAGS
jgi:hypothetical protein